MSETIKQYNLKELFSSDNYIIPIYQRNYAWGEREITQLIQDIVDYIKKDKMPNYYIGTLIVWERTLEGATSFETIDGQQRLTTLSLLLSLIKNEYPGVDVSWYKKLNLKFDSRKSSTETLQALFNGASLDNKDCNAAIKQGYKDIAKALSRILKEKEVNLSLEDFCWYLFEKVKILRVLVPKDTNLNHYFEIMNSRGEQLEKHEVLKSLCLEALDESDRYAFNRIWEACSNMERYIQYGFTTEQRDAIFGASNRDGVKWNNLAEQDDVYRALKLNAESSRNNETEILMTDLLKPEAPQYAQSTATDDNNPDRFNTIINFSNFLLHILRIQTKQDITLDDKQLIESFDPFLRNNSNKKEFLKTFGYNLLKGKFLFDKYIIKREFLKEGGNWSLKSLKWNAQYETISYVNTFGDDKSRDDINRDILMLLSMFHVSAPTLVYKHWMNGALKYVFENKSVVAENYKNHLESLAQAFLNDRFLATEQQSYFTIIYINNCISVNTNIDCLKLDQGTAVENFIFNYLDYLLWQNYKTKNKDYFKARFKGDSESTINDSRMNAFEYTFRSSVEHYYPQKPIEGNPSLAEQWLDNFGNLCLISSRKNSKLNNYMPAAKKDHYSREGNTTIDSIKQRIMMEYEFWDIARGNNRNQIEEHGKKMKELLLSHAQINRLPIL